jgi:hypothetical protein
MNAGVYAKQVSNERALHNLEHGAVLITYDPDLPKAQIATLTMFAGAQSTIAKSQQASGIATRLTGMWTSPQESRTPCPVPSFSALGAIR